MGDRRRVPERSPEMNDQKSLLGAQGKSFGNAFGQIGYKGILCTRWCAIANVRVQACWESPLRVVERIG